MRLSLRENLCVGEVKSSPLTFNSFCSQQFYVRDSVLLVHKVCAVQNNTLINNMKLDSKSHRDYSNETGIDTEIFKRF